MKQECKIQKLKHRGRVWEGNVPPPVQSTKIFLQVVIRDQPATGTYVANAGQSGHSHSLTIRSRVLSRKFCLGAGKL